MSVKQTERYVAFVFGVVFVVVMLALAVWVPEPKPFQYTVLRVVLALAGAGVAAMIPGFLQVEVSTVIRAGGALAVFVILYFYNPAALVSTPPDKVNEPKISYELGQDLQTTLYVLNQVTEGEPNAVADAKAAARERLKLIQSKADQLDLHLDLTSVVDFSALPGNVFPEREYDTVVQAITNAHGARASAAFETGWLLSWLFVQGSTVFDEAHVRTYPEHSQQFVAV